MATPDIYTLSLHDALPICRRGTARPGPPTPRLFPRDSGRERARSERPAVPGRAARARLRARHRSEEHTSELQSHHDLVCRLLLEKKKKKKTTTPNTTAVHG